MANRRQFIAGLLATGLAPVPSWADVGAPALLSAALRDDGTYVLCGISDAMQVLFQIPLPARGHAAAAHPTRPLAVAFARRPGRFAQVIDCSTGQPRATLDAPQGRHFYGHGVFSQDGAWLYTTENDYDTGAGRVGVWDAAAGFARAGEFASGGIGPHDIKRLPDSDVLVVANGGIDTHPDSGRTKLNIPTMRPNLAYITNGELAETVELDQIHHKNSIRHLSVAQDGTVALGMQWQGDAAVPPLVGVHQRGASLRLALTSERQMQGYVGSITFTGDGMHIIATSPRGGRVQRYDTKTLALFDQVELTDACGAAATPQGVIITTGTGQLVDLATQRSRDVPSLQWDNHLVSLG
ncbi:DUF1513 domain-containing protein [Cognatiyoonia sp. IB215182]|uniref:DUF1513 domain-containing protein n=1 Tax=Cognatiyoonia sp. IB215182 TaxID=3097353 RepID=UPI002A14E1A2|nr:DUF1513 domain-containing protein [Cognatiyoonia sp. IB215182]MDX8354804.1 DUF1513 domain-containing protein [Cognatiyoonia sp. IB215182]